MVTTEEVNLEELLAQLSDQARAKAISMLIGRRDISEEQIRRTIDFYVKAGWFDVAARVAKDAGMLERAQGLYERAVEDHEKAGRFHDAARVAVGAGMLERAVDVYVNAGQFGVAARFAEKAGMTERANLYRTIDGLLQQNY